MMELEKTRYITTDHIPIPLKFIDGIDLVLLFNHSFFLIVQYYTDPVSHLVFRTLKSVISYLQTGEISKHAYLPRRSVIDIYSFDRCTDLVIVTNRVFIHY